MRGYLSLHRYKGFLVRVVFNSTWGYPYEWTVDAITPAAKRVLSSNVDESKRHRMKSVSLRASYRIRQAKINAEYWPDYKRLRVLKRERLRDPTSMPTRKATLMYGQDKVEDVLNPQPRLRMYHKPR